MTPEFPRAPISAARDSSRATASCPSARGLLERVDDRANGERQIRAGIAVRDRIDVEIVDSLLVRLEVAKGGAGDLTGAVEVHDERLTSSMRTSTAATGEARLPLDLVRDSGSHRGRDLGEVEPVFDDDVEVDLDPAVACLHFDPVREPVAARETGEAPPRHSHDAVALGGDVADDLGDRLGRDGDPPEIGRAREMGALVHAARLDDGGEPRVTPSGLARVPLGP